MSSYRKQFVNYANTYEKITRSKHILALYDIELILLDNIIRFFFNDKQINNYLDFACGTGRFTCKLEKYAKNSYGIDVSEGMINLAKKKCLKTKFMVVDITKNQTLNQKYDLVTAFRFFKNAEENLRMDALRSLYDLLKDDGYFIFNIHLNTFSFMGLIANIIRIIKLNKIFSIGDVTIKTLSLNSMKKYLDKTGYKFVDYYGIGLMPGRKNITLLSNKLIKNIEIFFSKNKLFRYFCSNLIIIVQKK